AARGAAPRGPRWPVSGRPHAHHLGREAELEPLALAPLARAREEEHDAVLAQAHPRLVAVPHEGERVDDAGKLGRLARWRSQGPRRDVGGRNGGRGAGAGLKGYARGRAPLRVRPLSEPFSSTATRRVSPLAGPTRPRRITVWPRKSRTKAEAGSS